LSPFWSSDPDGKVKSALPVVELPRKWPLIETEKAWAPPPESETRCTPVSLPVARKCPRYQTFPVWKP
jgi:hypothetical protein